MHAYTHLPWYSYKVQQAYHISVDFNLFFVFCFLFIFVKQRSQLYNRIWISTVLAQENIKKLSSLGNRELEISFFFFFALFCKINFCFFFFFLISLFNRWGYIKLFCQSLSKPNCLYELFFFWLSVVMLKLKNYLQNKFYENVITNKYKQTKNNKKKTKSFATTNNISVILEKNLKDICMLEGRL